MSDPGHGDLVRTSPTVRLMAPSELSSGRWIAEDFGDRRRFRLPTPGAMLALWCMEPRHRGEAVAAVAARTGLGEPAVDRLLERLERERLVLPASVEEDDRRLRWFREVERDWAAHNWPEAGEYHLLTFDYEGLDYGVDGRDVDSARMREYAAVEPDVDRYKRYDAARRQVLPAPGPALAAAPLERAMRLTVPGAELTADRLGAILSLCFAEISRITVRRWEATPVMHRTSPSGGARHPTEAYVLNLGVEGLAPGWYHVAVDPPELELIGEGTPGPQRLRELFPGSYPRARFPVRALLVLTSVFERNMWRYREPRTFRTVHMDAGHLAATVALVAAAHDVRTFVAYSDDDAGIEEALGLSPLEEGYMVTVALG